jgi:predicted transcriptional regulator
MGKKDKTISFRVSQESFEALSEIADERDLSLSALFRDYVDALVEHDGQIDVVPERGDDPAAGGGAATGGEPATDDDSSCGNTNGWNWSPTTSASS